MNSQCLPHRSKGTHPLQRVLEGLIRIRAFSLADDAKDDVVLANNYAGAEASPSEGDLVLKKQKLSLGNGKAAKERQEDSVSTVDEEGRRMNSATPNFQVSLLCESSPFQHSLQAL